MTEVRHSDSTVQLTEADGNAFAVLGRVRRRVGSTSRKSTPFQNDTASGGTGHAITGDQVRADSGMSVHDTVGLQTGAWAGADLHGRMAPWQTDLPPR